MGNRSGGSRRKRDNAYVYTDSQRGNDYRRNGAGSGGGDNKRKQDPSLTGVQQQSKNGYASQTPTKVDIYSKSNSSKTRNICFSFL